MHPRAQQLIEQPALAPHSEGSWYRQIWKSEERVVWAHGRPKRLSRDRFSMFVVNPALQEQM